MNPNSSPEKAHILLADDHEIYRKTIISLLERRGYQVTGAACGDEVLAQAVDQPFDLFVLDYKMPGNDELVLVEQLKALQPDAPIIILTGFASLPSAMSAVRLRLFDYIQKGENPDYLLARVDEVVKHARLEKKLRESEARYRRLAQHLETVREEERKRLSRELHDDIGQILTALKIDLVMLDQHCTCGHGTKNKMMNMQKLLSDGIQSVHSLCRRLRPGALDDLGLDEALSGLIDDWRQRNRIECDLSVDLDDERLSDGVKTAVFRMVQESLTNVSRYAEASWVGINLASDEQSLAVSVTDNGRGMESDAETKTTSFGLLGMRERVEALGGTLHIESASGKGTRIEASIPIAGGGH